MTAYCGSNWSFKPSSISKDNSSLNRKNDQSDTNNSKDAETSTATDKKSCCCSFVVKHMLKGVLLGVLLGGIGLSIVLTSWLIDLSNQTPTSTTAATFTTTPISLNMWNFTGNMSAARIHHTSTYIPELNAVLLTGGTNLMSTEIVSASPVSFTVRGNMTQIRAYHTADRISTNVVLLAGGTSFATADLYDPIQGKVTGVVSMSVARSMHTSSVIENGSSKKILLAGGSGPLATGDVYNTVTGSFSPVSNNMVVGRWAHTATTVPNGYVIICGGRNSSTEIDSLELYNSTSNSFMPLSATLYMARYQHTATYIPSINAILFAGGWSSANGFINTFELFDVSTLSFIKNGTMLSKREWYTGTLLSNGIVLLAGGHNGITIIASVELYNPLTNNCTMAANMTFPRDYHTATLMTSTGQVMVCGGQKVGLTHNSCEVYSS